MTAKNGSEAVGNARQHSTYESGMCQKYVRSAWEVGSLYGSAIEAWNGAREKHPNDRTPPVGAPCYYKGGSYGHAVIFTDTGAKKMRSTDCQSSGKVSEVAISWIEDHWGYSYLGWTGDINAVDLPLTDPSSGGGGSDGGDDDMVHYDHGATKKENKLKGGVWESIYWDGVTGEGAFVEGEAYVGIQKRSYSAVLHVTLEAPTGATIRMRTSEWWGGERLETNPATEFNATTGKSAATHAQNGHVAADRNLRFEIACDQDATLVNADAVVLSFG